MLCPRYSVCMKTVDTLESWATSVGTCGLCGLRLPLCPAEIVQGRAYHHCLECDLMQMTEEDRLGTEAEKARYLQHNNSIDRKSVV